MKRWATSRGFTIVELLIVVVVIAILAAVTIVAYNGIQDRAKTSAAQSAASQAGKKIAAHAVTNADTYPSDLTQVGISAPNDTTYSYFVNNTVNPKGYCVASANTANPAISFAMSSTSGGAVAGRCIENLIANPNATGSSWVYFGAAGATQVAASRSIATDRAHSGISSMKTMSTGTGQMSLLAKPVSPVRVNGGEKVHLSYWLYSTKAGSAQTIIEANRVSDAVYVNTTQSITVPANTWTKFTTSWAPTVDINVIQAGFYDLQVVSGDTAWFDEITLHKGDVRYQYGDGDSAGGYWNGAAGASSSVNPVIAD